MIGSLSAKQNTKRVSPKKENQSAEHQTHTPEGPRKISLCKELGLHRGATDMKRRWGDPKNGKEGAQWSPQETLENNAQKGTPKHDKEEVPSAFMGNVTWYGPEVET